MFSPEFFGKGPTRWFLGHVALNQTENKLNDNRWGDRVKVRIVGHHPAEGSVISDEDLIWAMVLKPTSQGSLNKGSTAIVGGEWVIGFFLADGGNRKNALIVGVLGRSDPSYDETITTVGQKFSSEFKKTLNYFGTVLPTDYQTLSGGTSSSQAPTVPPVSEFKLKP